MRKGGLVVIAFLVALAAVVLGLWWAPFVCAVPIGLVVTRQRVALPLGALSGFIAWLLPLGALEVRYGLGPAASSLGAIMGFKQGAIPVVLTLIVGALLGLTGAWVAGAARTLLRPAESQSE